MNTLLQNINRENRARNRRFREPDRQRAEELRRKLEVAIDGRAQNNRKRYDKCRRSHALLIGHDGKGHGQSGDGRERDNRSDAETAPAVASGKAVEVHSDAAGDRSGDGVDWSVRSVHDSTPADRNEDRNSSANERSGALSEGDGARWRWDGASAAGGGGGTAMSPDDPSGSTMRQNTKRGELSDGIDPYGARIVEIRRHVDQTIQRLRDSHQALSRGHSDADTSRAGRISWMREAIGRVSDAIGRLVQRIGSGGSKRWFSYEGVGGSAAGPAKRAESPRLTTKRSFGPSGP